MKISQEWLDAIEAASADVTERQAMAAVNSEILGEVQFMGETGLWEDAGETADFLLRVVRAARLSP